MNCAAHRTLLNYEIKKNEMGGACRTYGGGRNLYRAFWVNMKEGENLEGLDIDGSKILK